MLESAEEFADRRFFVSRSGSIDGYAVHTCVGVRRAIHETLVELDGEVHDRVTVSRSLTDAVLKEILREADTNLYLPDPGAGLRLMGRPSEDIVREASRNFSRSCAVRTDELTGGSIFEDINAIAAQRYEGASANGRIILARNNHPAVSVALKMEAPVPTRRRRAVRKLLELSGDDMALLCDGFKIHGLGRTDGYDGSDQDLFEIVVPKSATWELSHAGLPLMRSANGLASLPTPRVMRDRFDDTSERLFTGQSETDRDIVWQVIEGALEEAHGTMVVISAAAPAEAARLSGQATPIDPQVLAPELVAHVTPIDGALLIDSAGVCYAIGTILDGAAIEAGDPGRGARYNSALRYLAAATEPTVIVIVSEDGSVEVLPMLNLRIRRAALADALGELRKIGTSPEDREAFNRAWTGLEQLEFYLDEASCAEANEIRDELEENALQAGMIKIGFRRLTPSAEMNDDYFRPD
ncbi:MAG: hypothetical protein GY701_17955 [Sulfitobacter sp.]|nr:hypothetical protein [Sulfitobacter sp.]